MAWQRKPPGVRCTASQIRSGGRPASRTTPGGSPRTEPGPPRGGSPPTSGQSADTTLQVGQASVADCCAVPGSQWPGDTTSCSRATPRSGPSCTRGCPAPREQTSVGGATAARGSRATISSRSAELGPCRSESCGKGFEKTVTGNTQGRRRSGGCGRRKRRRRF